MKNRTVEIKQFKALDSVAGTFEALVSVFNNVDVQGDRVMPGAFAKSIERWRHKGDPIPVVWSHQWGNPHSHVGTVDPWQARETAQGLVVRGRLDVEKEFARQVYDLLKDRRVTEWSFAYDTVDSRRAEDGANELLELDLHEVGPTLKGANSLTTTLDVKQNTSINTNGANVTITKDLADQELRSHLATNHGRVYGSMLSSSRSLLVDIHRDCHRGIPASAGHINSGKGRDITDVERRAIVAELNDDVRRDRVAKLEAEMIMEDIRKRRN